MEQWYDEDEDVLGVRLKDKEYWKSVELPDGIVIDISKDGSVIGIEISNAKSIFLDDVKRVIGSSKTSA